MPKSSPLNRKKTVNSALQTSQQRGDSLGERVVLEPQPDGLMRTQSTSRIAWSLDAQRSRQTLLGEESMVFVERELAALDQMGDARALALETSTAVAQGPAAFEHERQQCAARAGEYSELLKRGSERVCAGDLKGLEELTKRLYVFDLPTIRDYFHRLFCIAVLNSQLAIVNLLLCEELASARLDFLDRTLEGETALHLALEQFEKFVPVSNQRPQEDMEASIQVVFKLIEAGADIHKRDKTGRTPFCRLSTLTPKMSPEVLCTSRGQQLARYVQLFVEAVFLKDQQPSKPYDLNGEDMAWVNQLWEDVADMKARLGGHILYCGSGHEYTLWDLCLGDNAEDLVKSVGEQSVQDGLEAARRDLEVREKTPYFAARLVLNARKVAHPVVYSGLLEEKIPTAETANAIGHGAHSSTGPTKATATTTEVPTALPAERGSANVDRRILPPVARIPFLFFYTHAPAGARSAPWYDLESSVAPTAKRAKLG